jgi:C1A family cysteine protease
LVDDDCDGSIDCNDADCVSALAGSENSYAACTNLGDDDCDSLIDCDDPDCASALWGMEDDDTMCANGVDDDCDGDIDCADIDCEYTTPCYVSGECAGFVCPPLSMGLNSVNVGVWLDDYGNSMDCIISCSCPATSVMGTVDYYTDLETPFDRLYIGGMWWSGNLMGSTYSGIQTETFRFYTDHSVSYADGATEYEGAKITRIECAGSTTTTITTTTTTIVPFCIPTGPEDTTIVCHNGEDDDCDGDIDCADSECQAVLAGSERGMRLCNNFQDDDCDTLIDCVDPDCPVSVDGLERDPVYCFNDRDDDCDTLVDCDDPDCVDSLSGLETTISRCINYADDDCDGLIDCADPDCVAILTGDEDSLSECTNGADDDCDGLIDCADPDCITALADRENTDTLCMNGVDDDCDTLIDCNDPDCALTGPCVGVTTTTTLAPPSTTTSTTTTSTTTSSTTTTTTLITGCFDWRDIGGDNYVTSVKHQDSCGSCWAFSVTGAMEAKYHIEQNLPLNVESGLDLSEQWPVSTCCYSAGDCNGGWPKEGARCIRDGRTVTESCYNYRAYNTACPGTCPDEFAPISTRDWTMDGYQIEPYYGGMYSTNNMKIWLQNRGPVAAIMSMQNACYSPLVGGAAYCSGSIPLLDHGVLIVGYCDDPAIPTGGYWIVKNSWGTSFSCGSISSGDGYFKVAFSRCGIQVEALNPYGIHEA